MNFQDYVKEYIKNSPAKKIILGATDKNNDVYMLIDSLDTLLSLDYKATYDSKTKQPKLRIKDNLLNKNFIITQGYKVATCKEWNKAISEWLLTHKQNNKGMVFENLIANRFEYQTPHSFKGVDFIDKGVKYECKFVNASIQNY